MAHQAAPLLSLVILVAPVILAHKGAPLLSLVILVAPVILAHQGEPLLSLVIVWLTKGNFQMPQLYLFLKKMCNSLCVALI